MDPRVELNLALILFLPWFTILGVLFWKYPRQPRDWRRRVFDALSLLAGLAASAWGMYWAMENASPTAGLMWRQVLATSIAYGLFLGIMTAALLLRMPLLSRWARSSREAD